MNNLRHSPNFSKSVHFSAIKSTKSLQAPSLKDSKSNTFRLAYLQKEDSTGLTPVAQTKLDRADPRRQFILSESGEDVQEPAGRLTLDELDCLKRSKNANSQSDFSQGKLESEIKLLRERWEASEATHKAEMATMMSAFANQQEQLIEHFASLMKSQEKEKQNVI